MELHSMNTQSLPNYGGKSFNCSCGSVHNMTTKEIIFSAGAVNKIGEAISQIMPIGIHILLVADKVTNDIIGDRAERLLSRYGYRVSRHIYEKSPEPSVYQAEQVVIDEDVKLIMAVGGGVISDIVKYIGTVNKIPVYILATSPSTCGYLAPSAFLERNGYIEIFVAIAPLGLMFDTDTLKSATDQMLAAGYGEIISRSIALYDWLVASLVTGEKYCQELYEQATAVIDNVLAGLEGARRGDINVSALLAESGLRLSAIAQLADNSRIMSGADTQMTHALQMLFWRENRTLKMTGENEFLFSGIVVKVYQTMLKSPVNSFIPPPDNNMRMEKLNEYFGISASLANLKIQPYLEKQTYNLYIYKLNEYRAELLKYINAVNEMLVKARTVFKRLYEDDGYNLLNYIEPSDVSICLGLAPDVREKFTMLTLMKHMGLLEQYIT